MKATPLSWVGNFLTRTVIADVNASALPARRGGRPVWQQEQQRAGRRRAQARVVVDVLQIIKYVPAYICDFSRLTVSLLSQEETLTGNTYVCTMHLVNLWLLANGGLTQWICSRDQNRFSPKRVKSVCLLNSLYSQAKPKRRRTAPTYSLVLSSPKRVDSPRQ